MKRMLLVLLVFCISAAGLFAQQEGQFTLGARLGPSFGFNSSEDTIPMLRDAFENDPDIGFRPSISEGGNVNFNFALYGNYAFTDRLSLQAELNFMINQGYELSISGLPISATVTYTSLDIPILLRYSFINTPRAFFGAIAGPHISIPLGRAEMEVSMLGMSESENFDIDTFATFGLTAGVFGGIPFGPGRFIGDMRFIFDFNAAEADADGFTFDFMRRRALAITLGYEISF